MGADLRFPAARDRFPSFVSDKDDAYVLKQWDCEVDSQAMLAGRAMAELRKNAVPKVQYETEGYIEAAPGDYFTIADAQYQPTLYVQCRVTEQEICFTDRKKCKTVFDNFTEIQPELSDDVLSRMQELINQAKIYDVSISTDHGIIFKEAGQVSRLTASVREAGTDISSGFSFSWSKDGENTGSGQTIQVRGDSFYEKAVYKVEAKDGSGAIRGNSEVTLIKLKDGQDAVLLNIDSSNGSQFKNQSISTTLTITIFVGDTKITDSAAMTEFFGSAAKLIWMEKKMGESEFSVIPASDPRFSDNGFIFTVSPKDIDTKSVFTCQLDA